MGQVLLELLSFTAKGAVVAVVTLVIASGLFALARRGRREDARLVVRGLNRRFEELAEAVRVAVLGKKQLKRHLRELKKERHKHEPRDKRVFVLEFHGDLAATGVTSLRDEVSAVLGVATPKDEVVVRLESAGGMVHAYGLAASQLARIKERGLRLVVCIDKVAASGGYMMACLADELVAAPFAIVGSIGVVAQVPNLHRLLSRHGVDYEEMTAGEFKRTVSFLGEITPEGRRKFQAQLEETHELFKHFVAKYRPQLDVGAVSTGEYWYGTRAKELKLVDELRTSDDYLMAQVQTADIYQVTFKPAHPWRQRLAAGLGDALERAVMGVLQRLEQARYR